MKKFILDSVIFALVLLFILKFIKMSLPYHWGNELIGNKIEYIKDSSQKFNTFFIGASDTYRHIDPQVLDSVTLLKTFNLGIPGMFELETEYIFEHLLSDVNFRDDSNIFFRGSISDYHQIKKRNLHTVKVNYFLDWKRTLRGVSYFYNRKNYTQVYYHLLGFVENQLCIGQVYDVLSYTNHELDSDLLIRKGYYALDHELKTVKTAKLARRHKNFQRDKNRLPKKKGNNKPVIIEEVSLETLGISMNDFIGNLPDLWQYSYSPYLENKYYFDRGHYNSKGAYIYSKDIGDKIDEMQIGD